MSVLLEDLKFIESTSHTKIEGKTEAKRKKEPPKKDAASLPEFLDAVKVVEERDRGDPFVKSRDIVTLLLLFFTGIKISHLLHCRVGAIKTLLSGGTFSIFVEGYRKTGPHSKEEVEEQEEPFEIEIVVTKRDQDFALQYKEHIDKICENRKDSDFVITSKKDISKTLDRSFLDHRINQILREVSQRKNSKNKHITSHSFRIGQINHLIQVGGLSRAMRVMRHNDIRTTSSCDRRGISSQEPPLFYQELHKVKIGESHTTENSNNE